jgi:hypothetical protein
MWKPAKCFFVCAPEILWFFHDRFARSVISYSDLLREREEQSGGASAWGGWRIDRKKEEVE